MENYRLIIKKGNSLKIGLKRYTKKDAYSRKLELDLKGIEVSVMEEEEALGTK